MSNEKYRWVIVAAGGLLSCVAVGSMFSLPVFLRPISQETGWSVAGISSAMTIAFLAMAFGSMAWGTLADRIGTRPVVLIGSVLIATSLALANGYARSWRFDLGVFTNLSVDHFGTHGSWEHYLAAKAQLFMHLGPGRVAVLNAADRHALFVDHAIPGDVARLWFAAPGRGPRLRDADLEAEGFEIGPEGTRVRLRPSSRPKRNSSTRRSRSLSEPRTDSICSLSSWREAASAGASAFSSGRKSPR